MVIDKIIAKGRAEEVEDVSTQVGDNQETNSLSDDVVLGPCGWIHIGSEEIVVGSTENQVHCSPWYVTQETMVVSAVTWCQDLPSDEFEG